MKYMRVGSLAVCLLVLSAQQAFAAGDLFFSEYVEGSSYNKALEIYNGTGGSVDLSSYEVQIYFNGSTSSGRNIALSGTVADGDVFVLAHGSADSTILAQADQTDGGSWYNGDDAVVLVKSGVVVDAIGQIGTDPGSEWGSGDTSTQNNTLERQSSVCSGDTDAYDAFDPGLEWTGYAQDTFGGLGSHSVSCGGDGGGGDPGTYTLIHDIQGSGLSSPLANQSVTVEAIVVGDWQGSAELAGFFIQEEDVDADADAATSEGIFVYDGGTGTDVSVGDLVRVSGTVKEYYDLTELSNVTVEVVSSGNPLPTAPDVYLPFSSTDELERYEGMRIHLPQELTVTENYNLGRYGKVSLSSGGRLMAPTNVAAPGDEANSVQASNDLNRIDLDDGSTVQNPDPIVHPSPELTASNTLRSGDTVTGVLGVVDYSYGAYQVHPTAEPAFVSSNARSTAPADVGGTLRVASFNVLNYFNGDGNGGGFPTSRGADTLEEFNRQRDKIIPAIISMDADIIGLMEIENDGYGTDSAIQDLVNGLNAAAPSGTSYAFIDPGVSQIGTDEIAVGLIYRVETVSPVGSAAILDSSVDSRFNDDKNRPVLAQTFDELATGERLTVAVNHLKSKGSSCDSLNDPDTGDGQGNCNLTRTSAAEAEVDWLATDPTGSGDGDFLIIGDLNAYAKEDPITAIKNGGYTDLIDAYIGASSAYSYIYMGQAGYLDHSLANSNLAPQVAGVTLWHTNCDEPRALDYNVEYKSSTQVDSLYNADAYRASDHDAVLVGLSLSSDGSDAAPTASIDGPTSGTTVSGNTTVYVYASDTEDAAGTLLVDVSIDGGAWQPATYNSSSGYYELVWDTTTVADGDHVIDARATDSAGNTTYANQVSVTVSNGGSSSSMNIGDLDGSNANHGGTWAATVVVAVEDSLGQAVADATVSGTWTGKGLSSSDSCITGSDGRCSVSVTVSKRTSPVSFTVDDVTHATLSYAPSDNYDPDGDSDGTTISVSKP